MWRAACETDPTVDEVTRIVHEAAATKTRRLVLVTGVPGAGKTLVGLRAVHADYLKDLAVDRADGKPTVPAVFLSGNGPLVPHRRIGILPRLGSRTIGWRRSS